MCSSTCVAVLVLLNSSPMHAQPPQKAHPPRVLNPPNCLVVCAVIVAVFTIRAQCMPNPPKAHHPPKLFAHTVPYTPSNAPQPYCFDSPRLLCPCMLIKNPAPLDPPRPTRAQAPQTRRKAHWSAEESKSGGAEGCLGNSGASAVSYTLWLTLPCPSPRQAQPLGP